MMLNICMLLNIQITYGIYARCWIYVFYVYLVIMCVVIVILARMKEKKKVWSNTKFILYDPFS